MLAESADHVSYLLDRRSVLGAMTTRDITNDQDWLDFSHEWAIRPDTLYMNHGSFGPPPRPKSFATDACLEAGGAVVNNEFAHWDFGPYSHSINPRPLDK